MKPASSPATVTRWPREEDCHMDIAVTRRGRNVWGLADLLGRPLGRIIEEPGKRFIIEPDERGRELMARVNST